MTPATVHSAKNAASELDLAESGHLASGHKDHCKPQRLLQTSELEECQKPLPTWPFISYQDLSLLVGKRGSVGGAPGQAASGPFSSSVAVHLLLERLIASPECCS